MPRASNSRRRVPRLVPRRPHGRRTTRSRLVASRRNIVHVAAPHPEEGLEMLPARCEVRQTTGLKEAELAARVADIDALIVRSETKVTAAILDAARRLVVVGRAGVGVDNIDVPAATARGVYVVNAPLGNIVAAAEHTIALALALMRRVVDADRSVRAGEWIRSNFVGSELRGKTLGLVGVGRVGSEVARRASGFGMNVIAHDPFATEASARAAGARLVDLDELLRTADVISLHVPLTEKTRGLIGAEALGRMKPTAVVVNAARGEIVDLDALAEALEKGTIGGAALDVFAAEPLPTDAAIRRAPRTVLTPHIAGSTTEAQTNVAVDVVEQILDVLDGKPARYAVNAPRPPAEEAGGMAWLRLAERLGSLAAQLLDDRPAQLALGYGGGGPRAGPRAAPARGGKGVLQTFSEQRVKFVNALDLSRSRGLVIAERPGTQPARDPSLPFVK